MYLDGAPVSTYNACAGLYVPPLFSLHLRILRCLPDSRVFPTPPYAWKTLTIGRQAIWARLDGMQASLDAPVSTQRPVRLHGRSYCVTRVSYPLVNEAVVCASIGRDPHLFYVHALHARGAGNTH